MKRDWGRRDEHIEEALQQRRPVIGRLPVRIRRMSGATARTRVGPASPRSGTLSDAAAASKLELCRTLQLLVATENGQQAVSETVKTSLPDSVKAAWSQIEAACTPLLQSARFLKLCMENLPRRVISQILSECNRAHNAQLREEGFSSAWIRETELFFSQLDVNDNQNVSADELLFLVAARAEQGISWRKLYRMSRILFAHMTRDLASKITSPSVSLRVFKSFFFKETAEKMKELRVKGTRYITRWYRKSGRLGRCLWRTAIEANLPQLDKKIRDKVGNLMYDYEAKLASLCPDPTSKPALLRAALVIFKKIASKIGHSVLYRTKKEFSTDPLLRVVIGVLRSHNRLGEELAKTVNDCLDDRRETKSPSRSIVRTRVEALDTLCSTDLVSVQAMISAARWKEVFNRDTVPRSERDRVGARASSVLEL